MAADLDALAAYTLALIVLSAVNAAVTTILTSSTLFEPLRALMARLGDPHDEARTNWPGELVSCDQCVAVWVGAAIAVPAVWKAGLTGVDACLAGLVVTFATWTGAHLLKRAADLY